MTIAMVTTWHNSWHGVNIDGGAGQPPNEEEEEERIMMMATSGGNDTGWTKSTALKGLAYLLLSELFLHGFCLHPFFGYFIGVHRSFGGGFTAPRHRDDTETEDLLAAPVDGDIQPTMSTYSFLTSLSCFNLNYHVEHHDFPRVPW